MLDGATAKKLRQPVQKLPIIEVGVPSVMRIDLVQENELRHYEIFFSLASICFSTATGFWTSFFSIDENGGALLFSAFAFSIFSVISGAVAIYYRGKIYDGRISRSVPLSGFNE